MNPRRVPGTLDFAALSHLSGGDAGLRHFAVLTHSQRVAAVRHLLASGLTIEDVGIATRMSREAIEVLLTTGAS
jgi:hypothetical protein